MFFTSEMFVSCKWNIAPLVQISYLLVRIFQTFRQGSFDFTFKFSSTKVRKFFDQMYNRIDFGDWFFNIEKKILLTNDLFWYENV